MTEPLSKQILAIPLAIKDMHDISCGIADRQLEIIYTITNTVNKINDTVFVEIANTSERVIRTDVTLPSEWGNEPKAPKRTSERDNKISFNPSGLCEISGYGEKSSPLMTSQKITLFHRYPESVGLLIEYFRDADNKEAIKILEEYSTIKDELNYLSKEFYRFSTGTNFIIKTSKELIKQRLQCNIRTNRESDKHMTENFSYDNIPMDITLIKIANDGEIVFGIGDSEPKQSRYSREMPDTFEPSVQTFEDALMMFENKDWIMQSLKEYDLELQKVECEVKKSLDKINNLYSLKFKRLGLKKMLKGKE